MRKGAICNHTWRNMILLKAFAISEDTVAGFLTPTHPSTRPDQPPEPPPPPPQLRVPMLPSATQPKWDGPKVWKNGKVRLGVVRATLSVSPTTATATANHTPHDPRPHLERRAHIAHPRRSRARKVRPRLLRRALHPRLGRRAPRRLLRAPAPLACAAPRGQRAAPHTPAGTPRAPPARVPRGALPRGLHRGRARREARARPPLPRPCRPPRHRAGGHRPHRRPPQAHRRAGVGCPLG